MTDQFDQVLTRLQSRLAEAAESTQLGATDLTLPEVEGVGTALDEQVRVTMRGNEFTEIALDPRAMRLTNAELGDHLLTAFNAALAAHTTALTEALQDPARSTDLGALNADLRDIQNESVAAMRSYTDGLFAALDQARRLQS